MTSPKQGLPCERDCTPEPNYCPISRARGIIPEKSDVAGYLANVTPTFTWVWLSQRIALVEPPRLQDGLHASQSYHKLASLSFSKPSKEIPFWCLSVMTALTPNARLRQAIGCVTSLADCSFARGLFPPAVFVKSEKASARSSIWRVPRLQNSATDWPARRPEVCNDAFR